MCAAKINQWYIEIFFMKSNKVVLALVLRSAIVFSPFLVSVGFANALVAQSAPSALTPTPTLSNKDQEELAKLREVHSIREQVQSEVDRAFSRTGIMLNVWLVILTLFPVAVIASFWLLRRVVIREIVDKAMEQFQDLGKLQNQLTSVKQEAEKVVKESKTINNELEKEAETLKQNIKTEKESICLFFNITCYYYEKLINSICFVWNDAKQEEVHWHVDDCEPSISTVCPVKGTYRPAL